MANTPPPDSAGAPDKNNVVKQTRKARSKRPVSAPSSDDDVQAPTEPPPKRRRTAAQSKAQADAYDTAPDVPADTKPKRTRKAKEPVQEPKLGDFALRVTNDWKVGVHVSAAGGIENSVSNAAALGANAFALFLKSNRKWESPPLSQESIIKFRARMKEFEYGSDVVLPHSTYLINMANPDEVKREKAYQCFADDLRRCEQLGLTMCNFHPGSTAGQCSREEGIQNIAQCLNRSHKEFPSVVTVIECIAGSKNIIGGAFQDLKDIIDLVDDKAKVGVCLDTCHMFAAGYELRTKEGYNITMTDFEETVGFQYLKGMHLNDSKNPIDSKKDRHENIGLGSLGLQSFQNILSDVRTKSIPLVLETPGFDSETVWRTEIEVLNSVSGVQEVDEEALIGRVQDSVKEVEKNGWGPKGKVKAKKPAKKATKGKKKDDDDDDESDFTEDD